VLLTAMTGRPQSAINRQSSADSEGPLAVQMKVFIRVQKRPPDGDLSVDVKASARPEGRLNK
ncbi:hypothetical protein KJE01_23305, partial [Escherichia marmotae]